MPEILESVNPNAFAKAEFSQSAPGVSSLVLSLLYSGHVVSLRYFLQQL